MAGPRSSDLSATVATIAAGGAAFVVCNLYYTDLWIMPTTAGERALVAGITQIKSAYLIGTALGRQKAGEFEDTSCRASKVASFSVVFCWTAGPTIADRKT
jgi:hypothetical protein